MRKEVMDYDFCFYWIAFHWFYDLAWWKICWQHDGNGEKEWACGEDFYLCLSCTDGAIFYAGDDF